MRPGEVHVRRIPTGDQAAARAALDAILAAFAGETRGVARTAFLTLQTSLAEFRAVLAEDLA